jgi:hypothetical protein
MATRKFLIDIDLDQNSLISAVIENRDSVIDGYPSTPVAGQIFYDENASNKKPFYYDGTTWVAMSSATASSVPFSGVTTGTNTTATMTVGTGASLTVSGSGTINANLYNSNAIIALADGGTNANLTAVNGGILYSTASALAITSAGVSGQLLQSGGAGAPTWISVASLSIDHGGLTGLSDDDHTQYIHTTPGSSSRNIIAPTVADVVPLIVKQSSGTFSSAHNVFTVQTSGSADIVNVYRSATSTYVLRLNTNAGSGGTVGYIQMDSYSGRVTGSIVTSAGSTSDGGSIYTYGFGSAAGGNIWTRGQTAAGGSINASGGSATNATGGNIYTNGGTSNGARGGTIDTRGYLSVGGSITTAGSSQTTGKPGGSINTGSVGSSQRGGDIWTFSGSDDAGSGGQAGDIYTFGGGGGVAGTGCTGGNAGHIKTQGGDGGANDGCAGGAGGNIYTYGGNGETNGSTNESGGPGGNIDTRGADADGLGANGAAGGNIYTYASGIYAGGSINTSGGGTAAGGSITTNNGGGSINTTGNGSIQFGVAANRITLQGTSGSSGKTQTLPNLTGTVTISSGTQVANNFAVANSSTLGDVVFRNILSSDIPSLTGTYLRVVPAATSDNTVAPTASGVVGLVVKQTTTSPAKIFEVQTSGGSPIFTVGDSGGNTDVTVATNLTVTGNLTINGTTTTVNTSTLLVEDNFITVNSISAVLDAGIEVERGTGGTGDNAFIRFKETVDQQWYIDNGTYEWIIARRYSGTITGDNSTTAFNITHNMNSKNVAVQVYNSSDILVYPEVSTPNVNYVTITFKPAPGVGVQYRVVVVG